MTLDNSNSSNDRLDRATADRLARLATTPVDLTAFDRALMARIPPTTGAGAPDAAPAPATERRLRITEWLRPMRAVAASVLVGAVLFAAVYLATSARSVSASPAMMARMHADLVAGRVPAVQVDSIGAAREALSDQWAHSSDLPDVPAEHVMACCMKTVKDKQVALVLLKSGADDTPVTMVVGKAEDMRVPKVGKVERGGATYHVQSFENLNMVTLERNGRWVCLMAEMDAEGLIDLAGGLQF